METRCARCNIPIPDGEEVIREFKKLNGNFIYNVTVLVCAECNIAIDLYVSNNTWNEIFSIVDPDFQKKRVIWGEIYRAIDLNHIYDGSNK